jgi:hypothetical protein
MNNRYNKHRKKRKINFIYLDIELILIKNKQEHPITAPNPTKALGNSGGETKNELNPKKEKRIKLQFTRVTNMIIKIC